MNKLTLRLRSTVCSLIIHELDLVIVSSQNELETQQSFHGSNRHFQQIAQVQNLTICRASREIFKKKTTESSQEAVFLGSVHHFKYIFIFCESFLAWKEKTLRLALQNGKKHCSRREGALCSIQGKLLPLHVKLTARKLGFVQNLTFGFMNGSLPTRMSA